MKKHRARERRGLHQPAVLRARSANARASRKPMKAASKRRRAEFRRDEQKAGRSAETPQRQGQRTEPALRSTNSVTLRLRAAK